MSEETKDQGEIIVRREYYDGLLAKAAERDEMMTKVYLYAQERDNAHEEIKALHIRIAELTEQADAAYAPYREMVHAARVERDAAIASADNLQRECEQWQADRNVLQGKLDDAAAFHPRAMKLIGKRKNFVVVAEDEEYYADVYLTIRIHEKAAGRWTNEDEEKFMAVWKANYSHRLVGGER